MGSERQSLGVGLRLVEAALLAFIVATLGYALTANPNEVDYDLTFLRILGMDAISAVSLWLIECRSSAARVFIPVALGIVCGLSIVDVAAGGITADPWLASALFALALAICVYVPASPHARAVLTEPIATSASASPGEDGDAVPIPRRFSWPWWRDLGIYYCIASLVGHWGEIAFCWLIVLGIFQGDYDFSNAQLWIQWLYPYPAEGIAMVLCVVVLYPFKEWLLKAFKGHIFPTLVVSFFAIMAVCCAVDLFTGLAVNADYHLWDYRDLPFNFLGQIVLQNTLVYSVAATIVVWVVYPLLARCFARVSPRVMDGVFFGLAGAYAFLEVLYFIHLTPAGLVFG